MFFIPFFFFSYTMMEEMGVEPLNEVCVCMRRKEYEIMDTEDMYID